MSYQKFDDGIIVNYRPRNGQQDLCKRTCTPFLKKEVLMKDQNPWKDGNYYEVHKDGEVIYEKRDYFEGPAKETFYANEYSPINSEEVNKFNRMAGSGLFDLRKFLKIFKAKKATKATKATKLKRPTKKLKQKI